MLLDEDQYEIVNQELNYEEAYMDCSMKGAKLFEPKEVATNDRVIELAQKKGLNKFWIGIHNNKYQSDNSPILWSNPKPKPQDTSCDDNACFILGEEAENQQPGTFDFGLWTGKCCTLKKFGAVCDKKMGNFFEIIFFVRN